MNVQYGILFMIPLLIGCQEQPTGPSTPTVVETATANTSPGFSSIYVEMRAMAFSITPEMVGIDPGSSDQTLALVVDWRLSEGEQATIVCMADGGMSVYLSNGGGAIGGGGHEDVRREVTGIISLTHDLQSEFSVCDEVPITEVDRMRFTRITGKAKYTTIASVDDLLDSGHPLHQLANDTQRAMALLRSKKVGP